MFKFIFHILGIIFFLIWIVIGGLVLVTASKVNLNQILGGLLKGNLVGDLGGGASGLLQGLGDLPGLSQLGNASAKTLYESLSPDKQACVRKVWGETTLKSVLDGQAALSSDLVSKVIGCLPGK